MGATNWVDPSTKMVTSWKQFSTNGPPPPIGVALLTLKLTLSWKADLNVTSLHVIILVGKCHNSTSQTCDYFSWTLFIIETMMIYNISWNSKNEGVTTKKQEKDELV